MSALANVARSELLKARTSPVTWAFLALIVVMTGLNTSLSLGDPATRPGTDEGVRHIFTAARDFALLFVALGAVGAAGEFRHHTAVPTFLTTPARHRVLIGKVAAYGAVALLIAAVCVGVQLAIALPWIASEARAISPLSAAVTEPVATSAVSAVAYAAIGVALGTVLRNQIVALTVVFGWFAVAENVLAIFVPDVARFLPGGVFSGRDLADLLAVPVALALLAGYAVLLSVIAARTTLRQDI